MLRIFFHYELNMAAYIFIFCESHPAMAVVEFICRRNYSEQEVSSQDDWTVFKE